MVVYSKILKRAYEIIKEYKFLWIFGPFLIFENIYFAISQLVSLSERIDDYSRVALLVLTLLLLILYFRSKAGLIIAVKAIMDKEGTTLAKSFFVSKLFVIRILGIAVMIELGLALLILIIASPVNYMFERGLVFRALVLLIPGLIIVVPVAVVSVFISILSPLFVVIYDQTIKEAMNRSFEMMSKQWIALTGFALLLFTIGASTLFLGIFVIGLLSEAGLIAVILGSTIFLILQSIIAVFQQTVWVLVFLDLVKPQKLEEVEPAIAPEVAS